MDTEPPVRFAHFIGYTATLSRGINVWSLSYKSDEYHFSHPDYPEWPIVALVHNSYLFEGCSIPFFIYFDRQKWLYWPSYCNITNSSQLNARWYGPFIWTKWCAIYSPKIWMVLRWFVVFSSTKVLKTDGPRRVCTSSTAKFFNHFEFEDE